jgi:hypothetical protein
MENSQVNVRTERVATRRVCPATALRHAVGLKNVVELEFLQSRQKAACDDDDWAVGTSSLSTGNTDTFRGRLTTIGTQSADMCAENLIW